MTASTGWSLQRGIYQTLANSSELGSLGGTRIYDDAPQAASYPFITLGQSMFATGARALRTGPSTC
jgi:hypothetical protein